MCVGARLHFISSLTMLVKESCSNSRAMCCTMSSPAVSLLNPALRVAQSVCLLFGVCVSPLAGAQEQAVPLPDKAAAIIKVAIDRILENRRTYEAANIKPIVEAEKALRSELERVLKAGNLNGAIAIREAIESLSHTLVMQAEDRYNETQDLLGDTAAVQSRPSPIGRWTSANATYEIRRDGEVLAPGGEAWGWEWDAMARQIVLFRKTIRFRLGLGTTQMQGTVGTSTTAAVFRRIK